MNKKRNNKGFSLVELIVVIAVMAVLVVVLAPAYLRYVDKARVQKDESAVGEVVNAIKLALAEEDVADDCAEGATVSISSAGLITVTFTAEDKNSKNDLQTELQATIGTIEFDSSTYANGVTITVTKEDTGAFTVSEPSINSAPAAGSGENNG